VPGARKVFAGLTCEEKVPSPKDQKDETGGDEELF